MTWLIPKEVAIRINKTPRYVRQLIAPGKGKISSDAIRPIPGTTNNEKEIYWPTFIKDYKGNVNPRVAGEQGGEQAGEQKAKSKQARKKVNKPAEPLTEDQEKAIEEVGVPEYENRNEAEIAKLCEQIVKMRRENKADEGLYTLTADAELAAVDFAMAVKDVANQCPVQLAPLVAVEVDIFKCQQIIQAKINEMLQVISDKMSAMDKKSGMKKTIKL